jgi:hypothetical protein
VTGTAVPQGKGNEVATHFTLADYASDEETQARLKELGLQLTAQQDGAISVALPEGWRIGTYNHIDYIVDGEMYLRATLSYRPAMDGNGVRILTQKHQLNESASHTCCGGSMVFLSEPTDQPKESRGSLPEPVHFGPRAGVTEAAAAKLALGHAAARVLGDDKSAA